MADNACLDVNVKRLGHIVEVVEVVHVQCRSKHRVSMHWYQRPFEYNIPDAQYFQFKETPQTVADKGFTKLNPLTPGST
jgi:hypothetical protein